MLDSVMDHDEAGQDPIATGDAPLSVTLRPATEAELPILAKFLFDTIPNIKGNYAAFKRVHLKTRAVLAATKGETLLGCVATLLLNERGAARLVDQSLSMTSPEDCCLAGANEPVAAAYAWALALPGIGAVAFPQVIDWLRRRDSTIRALYARPITTKGLRFFKKMKFMPLADDRDTSLWRLPLLDATDNGVPPVISTVQQPAAPLRSRARSTEIAIARGFDDLLKVFVIRSAVYMGEQKCPFAEEFDGNDHCATHFLGYIGEEPAGCLRVRFFQDFAKFERLAIRQEFRQSTLAFRLVRAAVAHTKRKGFRTIYGHSREGIDSFWARFGATPVPQRDSFVFSDFRYTEMMLKIEPSHDVITLASDPLRILRPEGDWDRPGVLERSSARGHHHPDPNNTAAPAQRVQK